MSNDARKQNFILRQGFELPADGSCSLQYGALQFQPRIVGVFVLLGVILQSGVYFAAIAALLFGGFCVGSFVFHALRGRLASALQTLPWAKR